MDKNKTKRARHLYGRTIIGLPIAMLKGSKRYMLLAAIALTFAVALSYVTPLITAFAVDFCLAGEDVELADYVSRVVNAVGGREFFTQNFYVLPILIVICAILNGVFVFLRGRSISMAGEGFAKNTRDTLYRHLQAVPYDYHKHASTGDLIQRCTSDVNTVRRFISNQLLEVVRTVVMVIIAAFIMFSLNTKMALVSMAILPLLCTSSFIYFRAVQKQFTLSDEAEGALSAVLQENLTGMRVVRAFAQQKNEAEKFTEKNRDFFNKTYKLINLLGAYWGFSDMFGYAQILLTIAFGVYLTVTTDFSVGQLMAFTTYSAMLTWPVRQLGRVLADMGKAGVSLKRLNEILDAEAEKEPGRALKPQITGNIEYNNVCFGYDSPDDVLKNVSFSVKAGQTVAILGSTGSGKTSLVQLLQRLYTATSGSITIDGFDINDIEMHHLRKNISIVLQEPFLFSRTIMENIRITDPNASDETVFEAARTASIHDVINEFENGYDTIVGEKGVTLSGGQKQRVAIARMLIQKAPILIFDDSLSAVDTETDMAIRTALKAKRGKTTTFIISHRITTLCEADQILVLEDGKLVQHGTHEELLKEEGLYKRIAQIQDISFDGGDKV